MLVRLIEEWSRGPVRWLPGVVLELDDEVAAVLIEEGAAVPAIRELAKETR